MSAGLAPSVSPGPMPSDSSAPARLARLRRAVEESAHYLPAQGPIAVFIHHNTLHAFEHLRFEAAVVEAARLFGTEPFRTEEAFRGELERGRIEAQDIDVVVALEPNAPVWPGRFDRHALQRSILLRGIRSFTPTTIHWRLEQGDLATDLRPRAAADLFAACRRRVRSSGPPPPAAPRRARAVHPEAVHPLLIRLTSVFLDQGVAYWPMPQRQEGFYRAVRTLLSQPWAVDAPALDGVSAEFRRQARANLSPYDAIVESLHRLDVAEDRWADVVRAEMLALPGWAGLMHKLEHEPELAPHLRLPCSLVDFLAVRLTLAAAAAANVAPEPSPSHATARSEPLVLSTAASLFDVCRLMGLLAQDLDAAPDSQVDRLRDELARFDDFERRRVFHLAYERWHERHILLPLAQHRRERPPVAPTARPAAHAIFCIDEREEAIRRHLEEVDPEIATLGAAGFFGIAMDYQGIDDAHGVALCPVVVRPQHAVKEVPAADADGAASLLAQRVQRLRAWAKVSHATLVASRAMVRGVVSATALGLFSAFPLVARLLAPRHAGRVRRLLHDTLVPRPRTMLAVSREDESPRHESPSEHPAGALAPGFLLGEQTDRLAAVLTTAGLTRGFGRIVTVLGHGSTSLNNPHESAHDCGACGGRRGGPNGRAFAAIANRPEVRAALRVRGVDIPEDTWFVGGYHDTCNDEVTVFDEDVVPATHRADWARVRRSIDRARALSAHERARRFEAARRCDSPEQALRHAEERAEHLAEPRPEYGHCTNAVCIVGRRAVTRGLFLDRRAFLVSYDAALDPEDRNLAGLLGAVVPVCGGISLEYYFSFVDNEGYGCGTKLPHNITGLMGVMNGQASDLRTGLPWQMVEIHEPVRILFVVETTPARLAKVIAANPVLTQMIGNEWIRLSTLDPDTGEVHVYRHGEYVLMPPMAVALPEASSSVAWYSGKSEHLPIARISAALPGRG